MPIQRSAAAIQTDIDAADQKLQRIRGQIAATDEHVDGDGNLPPNIARNVDRLVTGFDGTKERLEELRAEMRRAVQREDQLEVVRSNANRGYSEPGDTRRIRERDERRADNFGGDVIRSQALRSLDRLSTKDELGRHVLNTAAGDHLDSLIRRDDKKVDGGYIARRFLITESDAYRSAFRKYIAANGRQIFLTHEENDAVAELQALEDEPIYRAMSENTTTAGGFGVPVLIDSTVILTSGAADVPILRVCRVEQVTTNLWQGVSSAGMSWSYSTEGTEVSDNSPALAQPQVRVHMPKGFLPYSIEVGMDYAGFATEMATLLDQGRNDLLATKTMTGSGTTEPFGIFVALSNATSVITPTTDGSFGGEDIFKAWNAIPERFRSRSTWVMSVSVQSKIRQFAASQAATSAYFTIDLTGGEFRINDRPVIITDYAPTFSGTVPGTTGLQNILAVGDWKTAYTYVVRAGMSVETVPLLTGGSNRFPTGQRGLFAWARDGANVVATNAARMIQNQ